MLSPLITFPYDDITKYNIVTEITTLLPNENGNCSGCNYEDVSFSRTVLSYLILFFLLILI